MADKLLLVDAYSMIYRAFFAIRSLTGPQGQPVNAIYGFTKMLRKLLADHRPSHRAAAFDFGPPKRRLALLPSYKEQRPPTPPDLDAQVPTIREILAALRVPIVEIEGEEADDVLATLAVRASRVGADVLIASQDKDFMQLVGPRICLLRPDGKETVWIDSTAVQQRYGVPPQQIVDLLCLVGDSVDNIRGVPGVGEKTAAKLLRTYGSVDKLLASTREIEKPKLRTALQVSAGQLRANRELITLHTDLDLPVKLDALKVQSPDYNALLAMVRRLGFKSLVAELEQETSGSRDLFADV